MQVHKPQVVAILEPRISGTVGAAVRDKLQFQSSFIVEAEGFRGGIWLLWNDDNISIRVLASSSQFIHTEIKWESGKLVLATFIYASPSLVGRRVLWDDLRNLARSVSYAWVLLGDFNAMVDSTDKWGGASFNQSQAAEFRSCIGDCQLIDTGFVGPKFTWFRRNLRERLDRCLGNDLWLTLFPDAATFHLERLKSDHRPLLVRTNKGRRYDSNLRPFRFNAAWFGHENFTNFLDQAWRRERDLCSSLQDFQDQCVIWNKEVFGHIFKRKRHLENRLRSLELRNQTCISGRWAREEENVRLELERTLWQEHMLWLQKSRLQWNRDGDRNTKFFHLSTIRRRKANRIQCLKLDDGSWTYNETVMKELALSHFQALFQAGQTRPLEHATAVFSNPLSDYEGRNLASIPSPEECYATIKAMGSLKAPGKDGFHPIFYQNCWDVVGSDAADFISRCFRNPELIRKANETIIVLIPKLPKPELISQFRPISLCNVSYKAITKCIADRLRKHMNKLIGDNQTSFVPGRQISENIIILQEVIHSLRSKTGKAGSMVIKLDLAKAYDRLEWSFVEETLALANFPRSLISLIIACISTSSTQISWNGSLTPSFQPGRGLRQGCPLSPFLFTLCIERLSILINNSVAANEWKPIRLTKDGPALSHIFFADDLVLFGVAGQWQSRVICSLLNTFCAASGQMVSAE
ncbi:Transposon TX1 uncharacterized 149 kDa protein [Linum perenne]